MFNPANFKTNGKPRHIEIIFEGPITPGKVLPRVAKRKGVLAEDAYLIGYAGKMGCFSVRLMSTGLLDVAFYTDATPEKINEVDTWNALYVTFESVPGWGYGAMQMLRNLIAKEAQV